MARPVTLFTGQWADLPFETICEKAKKFGYDGVELACWGDHFDVVRGPEGAGLCQRPMGYSAAAWAEGVCHQRHLVGQAVCDLIDERHKSDFAAGSLGRWQSRRRAPACGAADDRHGQGRPKVHSMPPRSRPAFRRWSTGLPGRASGTAFMRFRRRIRNIGRTGSMISPGAWTPILDAFEKQNVNFALEVHPTEIAFDIASAQRAIDAVKGHKRFGFNFDPSHLGYQGVDYVKFIRTFGKRIFHVHMKDAWWGHGDGTVGVFGGHTTFADPRRYWDFRSLGHGDVKFEEIIVALNDVGYKGPLSVEWEDSRMDREHGATEAAAFARKIDFTPSAIAFDAQFDR